VHMGTLIVISADRDACISQLFAIVTLVSHAFIIGDHANLNTSGMNRLDGSGKNVIGEVEDADVKRLLGHLDVLFELVDIVAVGEEECVHVAGLRSHQILFDLANMLAKVSKDCLVGITGHLLGGNIEEDIKGLVDDFTLVTLGHLRNVAAQHVEVGLLSSHIGVRIELLSNFGVGALQSG